MTTRLSLDERETIITFDETPNDAAIFTYSPKWQKQIEQRLGIKPHMDNKFGGREYYVPKARLRLPQPKRVFPAEHRQKLAKSLAKGRRQKSPQSVAKPVNKQGKKRGKPAGV